MEQLNNSLLGGKFSGASSALGEMAVEVLPPFPPQGLREVRLHPLVAFSALHAVYLVRADLSTVCTASVPQLLGALRGVHSG